MEILDRIRPRAKRRGMADAGPVGTTPQLLRGRLGFLARRLRAFPTSIRITRGRPIATMDIRVAVLARDLAAEAPMNLVTSCGSATTRP